MQNSVIIRDPARGGWLRFSEPRHLMIAHSVDDVPACVAEVERRVAEGFHAAGLISYEAAPAFDDALTVRDGCDVPLLWFGVYDAPEVIGLPEPAGDCTVGEWSPSITREDYARAIDAVREHIARGDTYQVNYTIRLNASFAGDPWALFHRMAAAQQSEYSAWVDTGRFAVCSASPELFFRLNGREIVSKPMKGTAPRGLTTEDDRERMGWLARSEKNRAENVMIADMIRNDLGRVAKTGSVHVPALFTVERYQTVLQMTSTVAAETEAPLSEILNAVFPCASITGAPKAFTMRIISELETSPRGVYTGAIGYVAPGREARFSVAIRTAVVDRERGTVEYGVGGGITWDSEAGDEYAECMTKARLLTEPRPTFSLLESLLWAPDEGYVLLDYHMERMAGSAEYFAFPWSETEARRSLEDLARTLSSQRHKVRLLLSAGGAFSTEAQVIPDAPVKPLRVALCAEPIESANRFLYHKSTHRTVYEDAKAPFPDYDDVILWNERGEVTESTRANVVIELGGQLVTPPVSSGLLAGTHRRRLIEQGKVTERFVTKTDLAHASAVFLVNSVRGWMQVIMDPQTGKDTR